MFELSTKIAFVLFADFSSRFNYGLCSQVNALHSFFFFLFFFWTVFQTKFSSLSKSYNYVKELSINYTHLILLWEWRLEMCD